MQFADSYLKSAQRPQIQFTNFVMYFINEYKIFKDEDKVAEYDNKLQNALKFQFNITGSYTRHTAAGTTITTDFDYDKIIDCWTHPSIEDKITVSYSETDENGKTDSHKDQNPLQFSWDFKLCEDDQRRRFYTGSSCEREWLYTGTFSSLREPNPKFNLLSTGLPFRVVVIFLSTR